MNHEKASFCTKFPGDRVKIGLNSKYCHDMHKLLRLFFSENIFLYHFKKNHKALIHLALSEKGGTGQLLICRCCYLDLRVWDVSVLKKEKEEVL